MRQFVQFMVLMTAGFLFSACSGRSASQQALIDQNNDLGTQIADLRASATVSSDLLMATVEQASTNVARVGTQQSQMIGTLAARGMDINVPIDPLAALPVATVPGQQIAITPVAPLGATATLPFASAFTSTPSSLQPTTDSATIGGELLSEVVTSSGVGADDCATGVTNQFTTTTAEIYVVAVANNIPEGTTISSRWLQNGTEVALFPVTFNFIEQACIWFFATSTDFAFTAGSYTVSLEVNGTVAGQTTFTIQ
ncbi:MAG: hypothetical protein H7Y09_08955 [Chitinophagaceae bacterium]|nr:hypothetical protein [Anaerolineae bacterium]